MSVYSGKFDNESWFQVERDGRPFSAARSLKIRNHSPDGFSWGYCGSGPAQLALGILLEETDHETAEVRYQDFKNQVIAGLPKEEGDTWQLTSEQVQDWLQAE